MENFRPAFHTGEGVRKEAGGVAKSPTVSGEGADGVKGLNNDSVFRTKWNTGL